MTSITYSTAGGIGIRRESRAADYAAGVLPLMENLVRETAAGCGQAAA